MFKLALFIFVLAISEAVCRKHADSWTKYRREHKLDALTDSEDVTKYSNFEKSMDLIVTHNERLKKGEVHYNISINSLSQYSPEEIKTQRLGLKSNASRLAAFKAAGKSANKGRTLVTPTYPTELSWVTKGKVGAVKDQGKCGSCWAFSTLSVVESGYSILKNNTPLDLSEQHLVDCSYGAINSGCEGGDVENTWTFLKTHAAVQEQNYPYVSSKGTSRQAQGFVEPCAVSKTLSGICQVTGYKTFDTEQEIIAALQNGPVTTLLDVQDDMMPYKSGVFATSKMCNSKSSCMPNHAVAIVGYGVDAATKIPYWTVRNSWSTTWGEAGYIRMARGKNLCCVESYTSQPILNCKP